MGPFYSYGSLMNKEDQFEHQFFVLEEQTAHLSTAHCLPFLIGFAKVERVKKISFISTV